MTEPATNQSDELEIPCPQCDYNLRGLSGGRCPSCGWTIDYELLLAQVGERPDARRFGVAISALAVGIGALVAFGSLAVRGRRLNLNDAFVVLSIGLASAGHLALAAMTLTQRRHWPMRPGAGAEILQFIAWLSVVLAVAGAAQFLWELPTRRVVRGVEVTGVLEFIVAAMLMILPGATLLALRMMSFSKPALRLAAPARRPNGSSLPTRASFLLDFARSHRPDEVSQTWSEQPRPSTPALDELIARAWEEQSRLAQERGWALYDGRLVRLIAAQSGPQRLSLELGPVRFREFVGSNLFNTEAALMEHPACLANALGISAVVSCADHALAFGRRGPNVAFHAGCLHTFGGLVEESDRAPDGNIDFFATMLRELREEAAVQEREVRDIVLIGMVRDREILQPELVFDISTELTSKELLARFQPGAAEQEHTGLEFVFDEPEAIIPFLRRAAPVAPIAEAALLLHGGRVWGNEWYEQTCYILFNELPPRMSDSIGHAAG